MTGFEKIEDSEFLGLYVCPLLPGGFKMTWGLLAPSIVLLPGAPRRITLTHHRSWLSTYCRSLTNVIYGVEQPHY
jgi:hypothetical protein